MKKTLIALAVAASAAVSGSAMAWEANGTGGSVNIGGSLTPAENVTPWEVKVGDGNTNLNSLIKKGQNTATINVDNSILALSIRVKDSSFNGDYGISPAIVYGDAIKLSEANNGITPLNLEVTDSSNDYKIGVMSVPFYTGGIVAYKEANGGSVYYGPARCNNESATTVFCGGLPSFSLMDKKPEPNLNALSTDILAKFDAFGGVFNEDIPQTPAASSTTTYNAAYGAGVLPGSKLKITLDTPVEDSSINWRARLPITVFYR